MKVYQLRHCEEYFMQENHGFYTTYEGARIAINKEILLEVKGEDVGILIAFNPNHYSGTKLNESKDIIIKGGVKVTKDNLFEVIGGYNFYDLEHIGYEVWGIYSVKVKE